MATNKAVKLDEATYDRLKALGETRQRTPHWLMKEAIKQFLEREEKEEDRRKDTLERIARFEKTGESIPFEVVDAWLATWGNENEAKCPISAN
ncbi:CopG family ribbon-helix-helix protein [Methylovulum psychrotolerans]|jgi:predicted transcriptional regulator|uniref:CopG family transcriptional regulator n=1 Tax=Methylovulum psychrotolerans TaxID=1704499 RepID=A0A1Z4C3K9_9GAMM|nr:ribbon-helix-helix protein, CopG family [Methylovulum psychrotolerans]ASF48113.1 CopG family transcriptional regulator [Methylovulum psychrotolerans]